jgi:hypothetical protein
MSEPTRPFMSRVEVGAYYTDGQGLYEVVGLCALGSVDLADVATGARGTVGIDAFRRRFWLSRSAAIESGRRGDE